MLVALLAATGLGVAVLSAKEQEHRRSTLSVGRRLLEAKDLGIPGTQVALPLPLVAPELPQGVPSLWETMELRKDHLYVVFIEEDYLLRAFEDEDEAISEGKDAADEEGTHQVDVIELQNVPWVIAQKLLLQGTHEQLYGDGYQAATAASPFEVTGASWTFNMYSELDFADWDEETKESFRESLMAELQRPVIGRGQLLYTSTNLREPFEEDEVGDWDYAVVTPDKAAARAQLLDAAAEGYEGPARLIVLRATKDIEHIVAPRDEAQLEELEKILDVDPDDPEEIVKGLHGRAQGLWLHDALGPGVPKLVLFSPGWALGSAEGRFKDLEVIDVVPL